MFVKHILHNTIFYSVRVLHNYTDYSDALITAISFNLQFVIQQIIQFVLRTLFGRVIKAFPPPTTHQSSPLFLSLRFTGRSTATPTASSTLHTPIEDRFELVSMKFQIITTDFCYRSFFFFRQFVRTILFSP